MHHSFFRTSVVALALLVGLVAGCSGGATTGDLDHFQVTLSRFEVAVTNVSGHVLTDVVAEIEPVGPGSHFVAHIDTLHNTQTRTLTHSNFVDRDSVPFSPRNKKAKRVIVTGKDLDGKLLRVEVPFTS